MTIINEHRDPELVVTAEEAEAALTPEQRATRDALRTAETTRVSLDQRVRTAVTKGGTLDSALGTATAWTPGTALTLRGFAAMTQAQVKALTLAQTQELLAKLAPLLVDVAATGKRTGKLAVQLFDEDA